MSVHTVMSPNTTEDTGPGNLSAEIRDRIVLIVGLSILGLALVIVVCSIYVIVKYRARKRRQQARGSRDPEIPVEENVCYSAVSGDHLTEYDDVIPSTRADLEPTYENTTALPSAYEDISDLPLNSEHETPTVGPSAYNIYDEVELPTTSSVQRNPSLQDWNDECKIPMADNIAYACN